MTSEQPAELRTERVAIALTPTEKRALEVIAAVREDIYEGVSNVLRDYTPAEAVAYAATIEAALAR